MIKLNSRTLSPSTQSHIDGKQSDIDSRNPFAGRAQRALTLWDNKTSSRPGRTAFGEIKQTLLDMCIGVENCNYCENNEATDVEHIYPKKLYPERAFVWDNYLLACKICNTTYKSDKFAVFVPPGSAAKQDIPQQRGAYNPPPNDDAALINPRVEDPLDFLWLDIQGRTFAFAKIGQPGTREFEKAGYTIDLLGLNGRSSLITARKQAARYFISRLEMYVNVKASSSFDELKEAIDDFITLDRATAFQVERNRIMDSIRNEIMTYPHTTVWHELKRQRGNLRKTNDLFNQAPEAMNW